MTQDNPLVPQLQAETFDDAALQALGLVPADRDAIAAIAQGLQDLSPGALHVFGSDVAAQTAAFSSQLLEQVRNRDLDATGDKLGEVVRIARELRLDQLGERSRLPLIGGLIDRMRASKGELVQKFSDTNRQIEQLLRDIGAQQAQLGQRIGEFDRMHTMVRDEHRVLGLHVAAGKQRLAELQAELAQAHGEDPQVRQRRAELDAAVRLLDKRVGDLVVMRHAAEQTLPMIRLIQANAIQLVEKFNTVRDLTIPSWKRQFAIQLSLEEQKNAAALSNAIDDATNDIMRRNAELMRQASVETAQANQRAVIDVETLRHVHEQLIATVEEVRGIHRQGMEERRQAEVELARLGEELRQRLAAPTAQA